MIEAWVELSPSDLAAWYGAGLASIVFIWELYKYWVRERPKVRFSVRLMVTTGINEGQQVIQITAVNLRTRPVVLNSLAFVKSNGNVENCEDAIFVNRPDLPQVLEKEGDQFQTFLTPSFFGNEGAKIERFVLTDTCGRKWKSNRNPLRRTWGGLHSSLKILGEVKPKEPARSQPTTDTP